MNAPRSSPVPDPSPAPTSRSHRTTWLIGGAIALIVLVAGVIAIVSTSGKDDEASSVVVNSAADATEAPAAAATDAPIAEAPTTAAATTAAATSTLQETQPVTITGDTLPPLNTDEAVGATAPTLTGASFDGTPITIAPGHPTLVVFLAHWCPHCQREVPVLVQWAKDGGVPAGLDVIGVATATTDQRDNYPPSDWLAREGWPWPVMADSPSADALIAMGGDAFPFFVLLDAQGKVVARQSGETDPADLEDVIRTALG